jgi:hypothetical protein
MKINRKELSDVLKKIDAAVPKKDDPDYTGKIIFTKDYALAYGMQLTAITPYSIGFEAVLPFKELSTVINKIKQDEIECEFDDNILVIYSNKSEFKIKNDINADETLNQAAYTTKMFEDADWQAIPNRFTDGVKLCLKSVSTNPQKIEMACLNFKGDKIESSDDFRISQYTMDVSITPQFEEDEHESILVLGEPFKYITKFTLHLYSRNDTWLMLQTDDGMFMGCRVIDGQFIDVDEFFDSNGAMIQFPSNLDESIESASIFSKGEKDIEKEIRITLSNGKIILYSEKEIGSAKTEIDYDEMIINDEISFNINPYFLLDILSETDNTAYISDTKIIFKQDDNFKHLISLCMI